MSIKTVYSRSERVRLEVRGGTIFLPRAKGPDPHADHFADTISLEQHFVAMLAAQTIANYIEDCLDNRGVYQPDLGGKKE